MVKRTKIDEIKETLINPTLSRVGTIKKVEHPNEQGVRPGRAKKWSRAKIKDHTHYTPTYGH